MLTVTLYAYLSLFGGMKPVETWEVSGSANLKTALADCKTKGENLGLWYRCKVAEKQP